MSQNSFVKLGTELLLVAITHAKLDYILFVEMPRKTNRGYLIFSV